MHQRIRRIREGRDIKQADAAEAVGIGRPFLSDIEGGKKDGSIKTWIALADFYDASLDYLVGRSSSPSGTSDYLAKDEDERALLQAWRNISEEDRGALRIALRNALRANRTDAA